ncbi:hypothetical protein N7489_003347 [Penicillium chrysogenum]|uniref:Uncharacterized protein n=1 Tax=Penicillium chrysogenum TaxID=5076 RepID=A0ABQ8W8H6_PENCH|nr:uncharacterized protein N7489_003347 [Penicillium chrysogenum]KAJ5252937.1 hypothetical protein N7489_003347 [Penicillium chrysogenum]KAJ5260166.1 hypothetical protein N7505_009547 [Penicillium chrysogenum]KAJ6141911.1 hypothetical protein N7497_011010 [Penicillium chrysogenum]
MSKNNVLRGELLPSKKGPSMRYLETESPTKLRRCFYNPAGDRRRKAYIAELLNFRVALYRMVIKLRFGTPEEISRLI